MQPPNQLFYHDKNQNISVFIKREDLIHPFVSGNKYRKLKYNLIAAKNQNHKQILTFGGAYSNHIAAVAFAAQTNGFQSIGVIRGEELANNATQNPTLTFAQNCGMKLHFVTRNEYNQKTTTPFLEQLNQQFGPFYHLAEGGSNPLAVKGCQEILTTTDNDFEYICCAVGTGTTLAGICNSSLPHQKILGFTALKSEDLTTEITKFATKTNWQLLQNYHFGGYAKVTPTLIAFMNQLFDQNQILLDPIYTAKMAFGVLDMIEKKYFPKNSKILMIHTGGLQGIAGINQQLEQKNQTLIQTYA